MDNAKIQTKQTSHVTGYSHSYQVIRKKAESKWPAWKITVYNVSIATSNHAKKLENETSGN